MIIRMGRTAARFSAVVALALTVAGCSGGGSEDPEGNSTAASGGSDAGASGAGSDTGPSSGTAPPGGGETEPDTDADGVADSLDPDDDNDGFSDANDPAPLDASVPGDFSTPEAILADPLVRAALEEAEGQGFAVEALTGAAPRDIGGYYLEPDGETTFVASDNGESVGGTRLGAEFRYDRRDDDTVDSAVVNFDGTEPRSYSLSRGALLRGEGDRYTRYSRSRVTCTVDGADFTVLFVGISTGELDSASGDIVGRRRISISVDTEGELTERCATLVAGGAELVGGWSASESNRVFRVEPSEFRFMCVADDGERAFAPTESWTESDGERCACTTDYTTECE